MDSVIIIGAGLGGLAAAVRLAAQGVRVTVLEKNPSVGGKVNLHQAAGFSFDTGASLLTMRHVVADLFASAGRDVADYLEILPLTPICRYHWPDGTQFDAETDLQRTENAIAQLEPVDVVGFRNFLADARRKYEVAERTFLAHSLNDLPRLLRPRYARDLAVISSWRTLDAHLRRYFRSPYLRQLFGRFATYNGSSPYRAPATFALIPYLEFGLGAWYVRGGMYEIPRAVARLAVELGVEIQLNQEVTSIITEHGKACGVVLADGMELRASAVIVNADALTAYSNLLPATARGQFTDKKLARIEPSCSGYVLLLGTRRNFPQLAHHNIYFSADYPAEFRAIFDELRPASDPTIYICATSRTDATQAPPDCENLFVLVNAPATSPRTDWIREAAPYRELIIEKLESYGLHGLRESIIYEHRLTPNYFAQRYAAYRGALYGPSSNKITSAFVRPPNKARHVKGLYFAGGTTHPGGGIPLVLLSGKMAAELVMSEIR